MPKRPRYYQTPPDPTPDQTAVREYLNTYPEVVPTHWATRAGMSEGAIRNLLRKPGATLNAKKRAALIEAAQPSIIEFFESSLADKASLVGTIGQGAEVQIFEGDAELARKRMIDLPEGYSGPRPLDALVVDGDSSLPFDQGTRIFYRRDEKSPPADLVGSLCIVELRDGRKLVKKLMRGYSPGRFNLFGWGAGLMEDQEVVSVAKVRSIEPV